MPSQHFMNSRDPVLPTLHENCVINSLITTVLEDKGGEGDRYVGANHDVRGLLMYRYACQG